MTLFRGSSRFESLILSRHPRCTYECNREDINDDDDEGRLLHDLRGGESTWQRTDFDLEPLNLADQFVLSYLVSDMLPRNAGGVPPVIGD